jgi:hypothetical protein
MYPKVVQTTANTPYVREYLRTQLVTLFLTQAGLHLSWAKCLAEMVLCLFRCRMVNLATLSSAFKSEAKQESRCQRLRRFLSGVRFDDSTLARMIAWAA